MLKKTSIILVLLVLCGTSTWADVFTLWPFRGKQGGRSGNTGTASPGGVLNAKNLVDEPMVINGRRTALGIALIDRPFKECLLMLKSFLRKGNYAAGPSSLLLQIPGVNGTVKRIYLLNIGGQYPVIQFSLNMPANGLKNDGYALNHDLPVPGGSILNNYFEFPERHSAYAQFSFVGPATQAASSIRMDLEADGWIAAGEASGKGDFFYKNNPRQIMVFSTKDNNDGSSCGTIYKKILKK